MILAEYHKKISRILHDDAEILESQDIFASIIEALSIYSKDRPFRKVADIAGDDGYIYALPSDWVKGTSCLRSVEYPAGERVPVYLESTQWIVYDDGISQKLRFPVHNPQTGNTIRITYTTLYTDKTIDQIPTGDQEAFCALAASLCLGSLSRHYAQTSETTLGADAVDYQDKSRDYADRAGELKEIYRNHLFSNRENIRPASCTGDWDNQTSWGGDFLLHPKKNR
jgi:hypothetical protein